MKQWLLFLVYAFLLAFGQTGDASATSNNNVQTASQWCFGLESGGSGAIIEPLVECFTDATQGIIPMVTTTFLTNAKADYLPTIGVIFILAIAVFGLRLYLGQIERIKGETVVFGLKMAGIMLFLDSAPAFYADLINILQQMSSSVASVATSLHTSGFCATSISYSGGSGNTGWQYGGLWQSWDCIFKYLLGFSTAGFAAASIASFLLMILFSMGVGFIVFFTGLFLVLQLLKAAFRFIHVYLMAVLALSFVYCLGYLLVPLLLFNNTMKYFTKWLTLLFGFVLTPVIMFGFMGMMLVALDIAIFSGQYSVYCKIGGSSYCGTNTGSASGSGGGYNLFKDITGNVVPYGTSQLVSGNPNLMDYFLGPGGFSFNGGPGIYATTASGYAAYLSNTVATGATGIQSQPIDFYTHNPISGTQYDSQQHPEVQNTGLDLVRLNMANLASGAGSTCTTTQLGGSSPLSSGSGGIVFFNNCPWIEGVLVSMVVAALLAYIMGSLLAFIPRLASNLSTDLNDNIMNRGASMAQSKIFGENIADRAFSSSRRAAMNYANKASEVGRGVDSTLSTGGRKN